MVKKAANSVELLNGFSVIKEGDTHNYFHVKLIDSEGVVISTTDTEITWSMYNNKGVVIANKAATLGDPGTIFLYLDTEDVTGYGRMGIDITVTYLDGTVEKFPSDRALEVNITKSSDNLEETPVAYQTITDFKNDVQLTLTNSQQAIDTANGADQKADSVQTQFNQVVIDGDSSVEAAQARVKDVNGTTETFTTLKERTDNTDRLLDEVIVSPLDKRFSTLAVGSNYRPAIQAAVDYVANLFETTSQKGTVVISKDLEIDYPVILKTGVKLEGPGTLINTHDNSRQHQTGLCILTGNYHPGFLHLNGGNMTYDSLGTVNLGDKTLSLTSSNLTYNKGDLVLIYGDNDREYMTKVLDSSPGNVTIEHALNIDFSDGNAFITKGEGDSITFTPLNANDVIVQSYFCEDVEVSGIAVDTLNNWTARSALLNGVLENIKVRNSRQLIYGNAYTYCKFDNIKGDFKRRCVEIADGGRNNTFTNIVGHYTEEVGLDLSVAPLVVLGNHDTLDGFSITDNSSRTTEVIQSLFVTEGATVKNGDFNLLGNGVFSQIYNISAGGKFTSENVKINSSAGVNQAVKTDSVKSVFLKNITVDAPITSGTFFRMDGVLEDIDIQNVQSKQGGFLQIANTADLTNVLINNSRMEGLSDIYYQNFFGELKGVSNVFQDRKEIYNLKQAVVFDQLISATTETPLINKQFTTNQAMLQGDQVIITIGITKTGTTSTQRAKAVFGGKTVYDYTLPANLQGEFTAEIILTHETAGTSSGIMSIATKTHAPDGNTVLTNTNTKGNAVSLLAGNGLDVSVWKNGDTMRVKKISVNSNMYLM